MGNFITLLSTVVRIIRQKTKTVKDLYSTINDCILFKRTKIDHIKKASKEN